MEEVQSLGTTDTQTPALRGEVGRRGTRSCAGERRLITAWVGAAWVPHPRPASERTLCALPPAVRPHQCRGSGPGRARAAPHPPKPSRDT